MKRWLLPFELIDMIVRFLAAVKVALQRLGLTRPHCQRILCVLVVCLVAATALRATMAYGITVMVASLVVGGLLAQRDILSWFAATTPAPDSLRGYDVVGEAADVVGEATTARGRSE